MKTKLNGLLGNDAKNTSNVDAISDKITQNVVKILLSTNKIDALNLSSLKTLSGGRKLGNLDTAKYTSISENQTRRMRKGDGVADVLSRLYGLLKGSHDEDVKQMELTRNFKEEKLKEGRKYSKVTHQTFGKKRKKSRTKTGLAGLAVLGLISTMGSIMDWIENFTAEDGALDQMVSTISESWQNFKTEAFNYVQSLYTDITGRNLPEDYEQLKENVAKLTAKVFSEENLSWIDEKALQWVNFLHNAIESLTVKIKAWAKLFHDVYLVLKSDPAWFAKPKRWKEISGIMSKSMEGYFTPSDESNLKFLNDTAATVGKGVVTGAKGVVTGAKEVVTDMGEHADHMRAQLQSTLKNLHLPSDQELIEKGRASASKMFDYAKEKWKNKDYNPLHIPGNAADWALGVGETLNKVSPNTGIAEKIVNSLGGSSALLLDPWEDMNYKPPNSVPEEKKLNWSKPVVINNPPTTNVAPTPSSWDSGGVGTPATVRNICSPYQQINMGNFCGT